MTTPFVRFIVLFALIFGAISLRAEDLGAVKARMQQRLSILDTLRKDGAIGENNRGFTEVRKAAGNSAEVSSAENRDRETVYADIAKSAGSTAEQVGRARARQLAQNSAAGVWIQRDSGEWYQK